MPLVKIKTKSQVTLPTSLLAQAGLSVGDLLEAQLERGKITLTPKSVIDRQLSQSLEDVRRGRTYGPFETAEEMIASLHREAKKLRSKKTNFRK